MNEHPLMDWINGALIGINAFFCVFLLNELNVIAAVVGIGVTIAANLGKIAASFAQMNAIRKNGWLPINNTPDQEEKDTTK